VNHLYRGLAPITDEAWSQIEEEAERTLKHFLAARKLVDFDGPHGWAHSAVNIGHITSLDDGPLEGVSAATRVVIPLLELRTPFSLPRSEIDTAARGAADLDLESVIQASRSAALAEDGVIFHGYAAGGITGITESSPHAPIPISDDYSNYPQHVASAVAKLRSAGVAGPYGIALGSRCFTGVSEAAELGGYPVFDHLREILGGSVVWAPAVAGAVVLSQRGGDFRITVGQDFSIGYDASDRDAVELYLEESIAFQVITPEAAVHMAYG
jgi:uncharacterized linocin/CFP29 family protein